jgi:hypothetical protein
MPGLADDPVLHATKFIRDSGWDVLRIESAPELLDRSEIPEETINRFDQALIDDEVYQFHTWPIDATDAIEPPRRH